MKNSKIIIYSHGFAVKKDDRGLFTDIAAALPECKHILFDYNRVDEQAKTILVASLREQSTMLNTRVDSVAKEFPGSELYVIAHSQGCVAAGCLYYSAEAVRKAILLAPPSELDMEKMIEKYSQRPGAVIDVQGLSYVPGGDGYTKLIPSDYWENLQDPQLIRLYNSLGHFTDVLLVEARNDEIVEALPDTGLEETVRRMELDADHNFSGEARQHLIALIRVELGLE